MRGVFPAAAAPYLFGGLLSAFMSLLVSGIATARALGMTDGFFWSWAGAWLSSWVVAFPIVLVAAPAVRRIVAFLVATPAKSQA